MFEEDASYHSPNVGLFEGKKSIATMMQGFFALYPDVYWEAQNYRCDIHQKVQFDFNMIATHTKTGEKIHREGVEQISFSKNNLISRLEVKSK